MATHTTILYKLDCGEWATTKTNKMGEMMKKFREFQNEVFGSGCDVICEVQTYRNGEDYAIDFSVWFSETKERMFFSWSSWAGAVSDWEEFKEQVRAKL